MAAVPTLDEVAGRLGVDPADPALGSCYAAAVEQQQQHCDTSTYTDSLAEALYRRAANLWASKAHLLGVLDTGFEFGVQYVPRYDPVVDQLEGPWRLVGIA